MRDSMGFSLPEAIIVLWLAVILAAAALPGVIRLGRGWALVGGTRMLESSLLWARMHAVTSNDSLALIVEPGGRRFMWQDSTGSLYGNSIRDLPGGIAITKSPSRPLRFYQHGNAAPAGTFVVQGTTGSYRVIVSLMGRIRIERAP